ncbi:MAG: DUF1302 family protein [Pseudomonadota bacterium]
MIRYSALLGAYLLSSVGTASAIDVDVGLASRFSYAHGTSNDVAVGAILELEPEARVDVNELHHLQLSARVRADYRQSWIPGSPNFETYDRISKPATHGNNMFAELRDVYLERRLENGLVRIGKQQIVWGALDGLKVLDVLNPQMFDQFILQDFDRSRIPLWSAYGDFTFGSWRIETAAIPDSTTHYLPEPTAWFGFRAPRYRFGAPVSADDSLSAPRELDDDRGTVALRVSRYIGGVDAQFVAVSGLDFEPILRREESEGATAAITTHERRTLLGMALAGSVSNLAVRAEVGYTPKRQFNTHGVRGPEVVSLRQWLVGVGLDWNAPYDTFMNLQFLIDRVVDAPDALVRPDRDRIVTVFLRRRFNYDVVELQARWYHEMDSGDDLVRVAAQYQLTESLSVECSYESFSGSEQGIFGQFRNSDLAQLTFEHRF